jgi:hypothetical protein
LLIECFALPPVAGTKNSDAFTSDREADGQDATAHSPEGEVTLLGSAMSGIFGKYECPVLEDVRCNLEGDAVLDKVVACFPIIPLELHYGTIVENI